MTTVTIKSAEAHINMGVSWPAILQSEQHDELIYIKDQSSWYTFNSENNHTLHPDDRLIDSHGVVFLVHGSKINSLISPQKIASSPSALDVPTIDASTGTTPSKMAVSELLPLVRQFAQYQDHCCSSKIGFNTISEGIELVNELIKLDN